jgi:hypothetical protein
MRLTRGAACAILLLAACAGRGAAQAAPYRSLAIETLGAATGSALGFGAAVALSDARACGEDLACLLGDVALAVSVATAASAAGALIAGRAFDTEPSVLGAIVGAVVGAGAAIGVEHLLSEEAGMNLGDGTRVGVFALTQGLVTALGSRMGARL